MSRLYVIVDDMHKHAGVLSDAGKFLTSNKATTAGGVLGGAYGAYKGSQGEDGGLKGALVGGLQGAAGGAIIGNIGNRVVNSGAFKGYGEARKRVMDEAGVADAHRGFFSRNFGQGRKTIKQHKTSDSNVASMKSAKDKARKFADQEGDGLITAEAGRAGVDQALGQNAYTNLGAARDKIIFGGVGAGMALGTGAKLIASGAQSGQGLTNEQRTQNLRAKYQQTGQLDPREQRMLTNMMSGRPQGSSSAV